MEEHSGKNTTIYISSKSHLNLTFNLLQCGVKQLLPDGLLSIGASDTFTLVCLNNGAGLLETNGLAFRMTEKQGFFCFPDMEYNLRNLGEPDCEIVWLSFTGYLVESYLSRANISRTKPVFTDRGGADGVAARLNQLYAASRRMPNRYCRMMSMVYDIFSELLDANPTKNTDGEDNDAEFYAARAVDYIERNYAKNLSAEGIATALGISCKRLYAIFNSTVKISPRQYLIYYRIEKACMRLKSSNQSVQEIAESVGYANQFYFSKEFKRLVGQTPTQYRKDPSVTEIFSYRSFSSTLRDRIEEKSMTLPMVEHLISVYLPPQPEDRGRKKNGDEK